MSAAHIETKNLRLIPHSPAYIKALIEGYEAYHRVSGHPAAEGLRDFFVSGEVSPTFLALLERPSGPDAFTYGFALFHPATGTVIGSGGYKGSPAENGIIEIAYGIVSQHQGKGYATEAAQALTDYAYADPRVRLVCAHTFTATNASTRVLTKCGFDFKGQVIDPEDGPVWRWEKPKQKQI